MSAWDGLSQTWEWGEQSREGERQPDVPFQAWGISRMLLGTLGCKQPLGIDPASKQGVEISFTIGETGATGYSGGT